MKNSESGFTLIELIVIMIILGILMVTLILRYIDLSNSAQTGACRMNQLSLETAQNLYYATTYMQGNGHYAGSVGDLAPYMMNDTHPVCPSGGSYVLLPSGQVTCTQDGHSR
jgi:prepilin-type N-terminal cleavage/methylation domain-containing protein